MCTRARVRAKWHSRRSRDTISGTLLTSPLFSPSRPIGSVLSSRAHTRPYAKHSTASRSLSALPLLPSHVFHSRARATKEVSAVANVVLHGLSDGEQMKSARRDPDSPTVLVREFPRGNRERLLLGEILVGRLSQRR